MFSSRCAGVLPACRSRASSWPNSRFQVTDRIYQVRGFDISNMTIIEGETGLILIDPLTATETRTIDGVQIEFLMAPGTEAPAEMLLYLPQWKALCAAEDATHNLYTIRGAQVRETQAGRARVDGDPQALGAWVALMDKFEPNFGIVTP